jgi:HAE1 family hydrophobic/amphiphilic exporter-1
LIVEFARQKQSKSNISVLEAAIQGALMRFRPILMTSLAFIAGLIPMVLSSGAGSVANHTIGASALGGMLFGTFFGLIIVPSLYYIFGTLDQGRILIKNEDKEPLTEHKLNHNFDE